MLTALIALSLKKLTILIIILSSITSSHAQSTHKISFHPTFGKSPLHLDDSCYTKYSIYFSQLKLYISSIEFLNKDSVVWKETNGYHLLDASDEKTLYILLSSPTNLKFTKIKFNLGIDSITNVSGAMGGDLDPTKGMYWTWQSGYINLKLEGKSKLCKTRNNEFQFHLGGYQNGDNALQTIILNVSENKEIDILIDIEQFVAAIDLSEQNQIMSPGKKAVLLSEKFSKIFSIQKQ